jgi:hypothetical protein
MKYNAVVMSNETAEKIIGGKVEFSNGFFSNQRVDWWGALEKHIGLPVVSVRPSGRESWNEIIILCANGTVGDEFDTLDYQTAEELENILHDIFTEADNDEYEVFEQYRATCSDEVWKEVTDWVHEVY